jgi:phosphatidylglycerol---prolipoprotein diacylglyceryl transferase
MLPQHHLYEAAWGAAALSWGTFGTVLLRQRTGGAATWPRLLALVVLAIAATLVGARLHFVALAPDLIATLGWRVLLPLDEGAGLRITGGLLAGAAVIAAFGPAATTYRLGRGAVADALVPAAGLAIAIGRLGCFADGCCFGVPCRAPWCVGFPAGSPVWWSHIAQGLVGTSADASLPVHPVQLYLSLAGLIASAVSLGTWPDARLRDGTRALAFVVVLSLLRAAIEPLRETSFGAGVAHEPLVDLTIAIAALAALGWRLGQRAAVGRAASGS